MLEIAHLTRRKHARNKPCDIQRFTECESPLLEIVSVIGQLYFVWIVEENQARFSFVELESQSDCLEVCLITVNQSTIERSLLDQ